MTIAQIKALFQTGKIPTQADFENLISKIPNDDLTMGEGDSTLRLYNPSAPHVLGYRFISIDDNYTYIFLGLYDASNGTVIPYIILRCNQGRPLEENGIVPVDYTILDGSKMNEWYSAAGNKDMHEVDDTTLINAIPADISWRDIGVSYGKRYSAIHVLLEATDVYEKHWYNTTGSLGTVVEMAKTDEDGRWIIYHIIQISVTKNIASIKEYIPNGTATLDSTYDSYVNSFRNNPNRPSNLATFIANYLKNK